MYICSNAKWCIERLQDKIIIIILFLQHTSINSACLSFRLKNIQLCFIYIFCMWTDDRKYLYKSITLLEKNNHMSPFHLDLTSFSIVTLVHIFSQVLAPSSKRKCVSIGMKHLALHPYHLKKNPYIFQSSSFNYEWTPNNRHYQNVWNRASVPSKKMHRHPT